MEKKFTLSAAERLKSRKMLDQVFKTGKRINQFPLRASFLVDEETSKSFLQYGCSAPVRNFKKAVDRNRVKRLLKEAFRLQKHILLDELAQKDKRLVIFVIYSAPGLPKFITIKTVMGELLLKLKDEIQLLENTRLS